MFHQSLSVRFRAIEALQAIRARHTPGTFRYEDIEHAIDLALRDRRSVDQYLLRNILRDATRIRTRRASTHPVMYLDDMGEADGGTSQDAHPYFSDSATPEALAMANDLAAVIVASVAGNRAVIERTFDGLVAGETACETAKACAIGVGYVEKIRMSIKAVARQHGGAK